MILLLLHSGTVYEKGQQKEREKEGSATLLYKMLDRRGLAGSRPLCLLASVVVWHVRNRKHGTARHSTAQHGSARHRTAGHDTARHRTALRRAVELAKRSGAGVIFLRFQVPGCDLRKNEKITRARTYSKRLLIDVPMSCHSLGRQSLGRQSLGHLRSTWIALRGRACEVFGRG